MYKLTGLPMALAVITLSTATIAAQKKSEPPISQLCTRSSALDMIQQQNAMAKTMDNPVQRIAVMLRAADMSWPYQREKARATFIEAFDLASQYFKEAGDADRRDSQFHVTRVPDQRFKVITAYAKRDSAAARKLSEQVLDEQTREATDKPATDASGSRKNAEKLLLVAESLVATDQPSAVSFARASLRHAAPIHLPGFLYALAKVNKVAAEQFYEEALAAYANAAMDQFLYLSSFPFGNNREAGEMPSYTFYKVPDGFTPNVRLQRLFVQRLLARTQAALEAPVDETPSPDYRRSDPAQMWMALSRLEKQINDGLPDLGETAKQARDKLYALLSAPSQRNVSRIVSSDSTPKKSFEEQVEAALKLTDVDRRDQQLTFAVTGASANETVEQVVDVIDKISDAKVRAPLQNWFYFFRTQSLIKDKNLAEARKVASKVTELDQRAYLYSRIAEESLKEAEDQTQARELLNEIADAAAKAPNTIVTARALLALAYLYSKIDTNRSIEELANAVRSINRLEAPDFSQQSVTMKIEGKTFGSFAAYSTPGFSPENAFREIGKLDFDGSLAQAATFTDKPLRALSTLALIEPCLQEPTKAKPKR
jgi:tetratricopeptide (TPR) repeat protein